jgi:hypothetical protein
MQCTRPQTDRSCLSTGLLLIKLQVNSFGCIQETCSNSNCSVVALTACLTATA